ncbi:Folylpolyglutamate synthase [bacterium HR41]|nr:Folylpolyglutamate synthase [bacterium HR41]
MPLPSPDYREAERWLLSRELFGMRFGLDRMRRLLTVLGSPQRAFRTIHIVGTNGKSSVTRFASALLAAEGLRAGAYTSPHLVRFGERIQIEGREIDDATFADAVARVRRATALVERSLTEGDRVTQFEALTAVAFLVLAEARVEVAAIEAGLGGRFDATNVIDSEVQVLTSVGLEHTRWLGPTVADIAREKLDVVRPGATLVCGPVPPEAEAVAERVCRERRARLVPVGEGEGDVDGGELAARGRFQRLNFALARRAVACFLGRPLSALAVRRAARTTVPGRLEQIGERPLTIVDVAHNPDAVRALCASLDEVLADRRPRVAIVAILDDKDAAAMLRELGAAFDVLVLTRATNLRSLPAATLDTLAAKVAPAARRETAVDAHSALARARELAGADGCVVVTGSIYLVGDLLRPPGAPPSML